ncbi:MAG TPA: hemerythrin domain-containing protein [Polyangiaceae bacterium]|nr:hemerythrin domain-containing protein [Polyangiaceae bacterium]
MVNRDSIHSNELRLREARRKLLVATAASTAGILLASCAASARGGDSPSSQSQGTEAEVTPGEDLMQEHGVIERVLLIYDEAARRIEQGQQLELSVLSGAGLIVRRFVAEYHEKLEEQFVFPPLQKAGRESELVAVLLRQHERGRQLTEEIVKRAQSAASPELAQALRAFVRMYRPHAAREDTVVFPAFRDVVGGAAYRELGEQFEDKEHQLFGEHGFENIVKEVSKLEAALKIDNLADFTPP